MTYLEVAWEEGCSVGRPEGCPEGRLGLDVGCLEGIFEGWPIGCTDGAFIGCFVGCNVGMVLGCEVGRVGSVLGRLDGRLGFAEG